MSDDEEESKTLSRRALLSIVGGGTATAGAIGFFGYKHFSKDDEPKLEKPDMSHMDVADSNERGDKDPQDILDTLNVEVEKIDWPNGSLEQVKEKLEKLPNIGSRAVGVASEKD